mgnify:CR=1 FL=1
MTHWTQHPSWTAGFSPRIHFASRRFLCAAVAACLVLAGPSLAGRDEPVRRLQLLPELIADIMPDGHLDIGSESLAFLEVDVAPPGDARRVRRHDGTVFVGESREGEREQCEEPSHRAILPQARKPVPDRPSIFCEISHNAASKGCNL